MLLKNVVVPTILRPKRVFAYDCLDNKNRIVITSNDYQDTLGPFRLKLHTDQGPKTVDEFELLDVCHMTGRDYVENGWR
jgi:hypothetical protein